MANFNHSYAWDKKDKNDLGASNRQLRRIQTLKLKKFEKRILDKFWWNSLSSNDREKVFNARYYGTWSNYGPITYSDTEKIQDFDEFINDMKESYPGNLNLRRDMVIDNLLK